MSGYSTFACSCGKIWESTDYNDVCLDCRNKKEFDKYIDMFMSMCLDYKMGGISKSTIINNMKIAMINMEKL